LASVGFVPEMDTQRMKMEGDLRPAADIGLLIVFIEMQSQTWARVIHPVGMHS
jgi:hypothetical protein